MTQEEFETRRREYHRELQAAYFAGHRIVGTRGLHRPRRGLAAGRSRSARGEVPLWLLQQYNPDLDFADLRPGTQIVVPRVEEVRCRWLARVPRPGRGGVVTAVHGATAAVPILHTCAKTMSFRVLAGILLAVLHDRGGAAPTAWPRAQPVMLRPSHRRDRLPQVDRVVVHKAERRLVLMHGGNVLRSYHVALGLNPIGQKERAGRLPHARGQLPARAAQPAQRLLPVDPGVLSERRGPAPRARRSHWDTGGSIMIHGLPNILKHEPEYYETPRLDRWLHRRVQRRHGGDLDADAG